MGNLYRSLAADYHLLFPARQAQLDFLTGLAGPPPARVLDVASGTGEYVAALFHRGYDACGVEIDELMHSQALDRHYELLGPPGAPPRLLLGDMTSLNKTVTGSFDLIYCIGNSLSHLDSVAQVASVIDLFWKLTRPAGSVVIQLTNYERVLHGGYRSAIAGDQRVTDRNAEPSFVYDLPVLNATREDGQRVEFSRQYLMRRAADLEQTDQPPEKLIFHTVLAAEGPAQESFSPMLLLTSERLGYCLPRDADRRWYGTYGMAEWTADSPATIVVLK